MSLLISCKKIITNKPRLKINFRIRLIAQKRYFCFSVRCQHWVVPAHWRKSQYLSSRYLWSASPQSSPLLMWVQKIFISNFQHELLRYRSFLVKHYGKTTLFYILHILLLLFGMYRLLCVFVLFRPLPVITSTYSVNCTGNFTVVQTD
jgi:hypothetical protein